MSNFDKMKSLRDSLKSGNKSKVIYFKDDTKTMVRILPVKGEDIPFKNAYVHYPSNQVVPKTSFSPKSWGEKDELEDTLNRELSKGHQPPETFKFLINLKPVPVVIVPVIERDNESQGVQLWVMAQNQFDSFFEVLTNTFHPKTPPDIWDIEEGFDVIVDAKSKKTTGKKYRSIDYAIARDATPLQTQGVSNEQVDEWLSDQPSWKEAYPEATNEELKEYYKNHLEGEDTDDEELDDDLAGYATEEELDKAPEEEVDEETSDVVKNALNKFKGQTASETQGSSQGDEAVTSGEEENPFAKKG